MIKESNLRALFFQGVKCYNKIMFQNMGVWDWGIILVIVLILFGGKRLPDLAKSLGESIAIFKKSMKDGHDEKSDSSDKSSKDSSSDKKPSDSSN